MGASFGTKVTRYERFSRRPSVITVFAYEIIFDQPVRELFAGAYESVRQDVQTRASELLEILAAESADLRTARKLQVLRAIVETKPSPSGCDQA